MTEYYLIVVQKRAAVKINKIEIKPEKKRLKGVYLLQ